MEDSDCALLVVAASDATREERLVEAGLFFGSLRSLSVKCECVDDASRDGVKYTSARGLNVSSTPAAFALAIASRIDRTTVPTF